MIRTIRRSTAQRALAAAGILASGALLLTGCSSSSPKTATAAASASASTGAGGSGSAQFTAYRTCLSQHGVTLPTGRPSGHFTGRPSGRPTDRPSGSHTGGYGGGFGGGFGFGGASANPSEAAAAKACASLMPKGGFGGRGGGAAGGTAMAAFTSCMKDNGVTVTGGLRGLSTTDPKTAAALKICKPLLPTRGSGPSPSATPSS